MPPWRIPSCGKPVRNSHEIAGAALDDDVSKHEDDREDGSGCHRVSRPKPNRWVVLRLRERVFSCYFALADLEIKTAPFQRVFAERKTTAEAVTLTISEMMNRTMPMKNSVW